ncbi:hypothetical protein BJV85_002850 [Clostridium acetobutylicum]|uniref:DUF4121 family protein n=2 Tax=Clostridium acetobutylicum TaxID=1488 RepID=Q97JX4_CLOAB|nr:MULTISPECIES: DUF4121 family protein [Clostridium]AAK79121.1 Hypothetical protein CA_C1149 [Clostridium acetobutylicum ATCC 824]ADZ20199.1 Conserved hypothetical protein [Clostridium acetobutylicum EA 2018]AEI31657.1 hypothetical protein SMB_G1169 [Clostridium acetobutylicum DSM 1731]AWV82257.1 DUF4121 family protein [Clostridium acetobutylicum]MBC2393269.1 DUF4121 family protein [Clostridium acetobutylicum]
MYTLEKLRELNKSYDYEHTLNESDVEKANSWVKKIEGSRNKNFPQVGDIVEYTTKNGDYYKNAHIENIYVKDKKIYICEEPYVPFLCSAFNEINTSTSGGAWAYIPTKLKLIGEREKSFRDWGHCGGCGNGAITFKAIVNVWKYEEIPNLKYTTEYYDKIYITINPEDDYKYTSRYGAWKNDEIFSAWIQAYKGNIEKSKFNDKCFTVWIYKSEKVYCETKEEYEKIEGIKDTLYCNGNLKYGLRECKRVYDDKNKKMVTYIPLSIQ